ncbi:MAG: TIGR00295 family protein [Archaeoglobaceae archaeon]|nr:TIGR00295 family protein [Archaeoglobaceae archaeon]MDW7989206.1 TIGR00295 family protein [Archaeoglobaceae archaeon]
MISMIPQIVEKLWNKYDLEGPVREHCKKVMEFALRIAERAEKNGLKLDKKIILFGALLHDIGRAITHDPFQHFLKSAEILRNEGLEEEIVRIVERHFSAGITAKEAEKLGLPIKDYIPETLEEKIVSFADNLTFGSEIKNFKSFLERLERIDLEKPDLKWFTEETRKRAIKMKEEIEKITGMEF